MDEATATAKAMDEIAETPEGKEVIAVATQEVVAEIEAEVKKRRDLSSANVNRTVGGAGLPGTKLATGNKPAVMPEIAPEATTTQPQMQQTGLPPVNDVPAAEPQQITQPVAPETVFAASGGE